jgi:single-strand DNA-binding protein
VNSVNLIANLTKDPELKHTASGAEVCNMRVAWNEKWRDSSGELQERPGYIDVTAWGKLATTCAEYLARGRRVGITGKLQWREWETDDGSKRQAIEIVASNVTFLSDGSNGENRENRENRYTPAARSDFPASPIDDDIPF